MDKFNVIWCTLWSDFFMAQYQYDNDSLDFQAPSESAVDFLFYLSELLGYTKKAFYTDNDEDIVYVTLSKEEIEKITDWILDFNFSTRGPAGLMMPDLYLDEPKISLSTLDVYFRTISDFVLYMVKNQHVGRNEIADWAATNFVPIYFQAHTESLKLKEIT